MKCHIPSCLGHADERSARVTCSRCQGERYIPIKPANAPDPTDYVCQRCRCALRGGRVQDPLARQERIPRQEGA